MLKMRNAVGDERRLPWIAPLSLTLAVVLGATTAWAFRDRDPFQIPTANISHHERLKPANPDDESPADPEAHFEQANKQPPALREAAIDRCIAREKDRGLWVQPMEGARAALDTLAAMGLRLGVVSNSDGRAAFHLENADMRRGVEFVVDSHLVGIEKPDSAIFRVALGKLGTLPERTLFVGDIRSIDEAGARAAEMHFVLLDPYGDYGDPGSPRISGMHELAAWVGKTFSVPTSVAGGPPTGSHGAADRRHG